jgi:hypothetical protein
MSTSDPGWVIFPVRWRWPTRPAQPGWDWPELDVLLLQDAAGVRRADQHLRVGVDAMADRAAPGGAHDRLISVESIATGSTPVTSDSQPFWNFSLSPATRDIRSGRRRIEQAGRVGLPPLTDSEQLSVGLQMSLGR